MQPKPHVQFTVNVFWEWIDGGVQTCVAGFLEEHLSTGMKLYDIQQEPSDFILYSGIARKVQSICSTIQNWSFTYGRIFALLQPCRFFNQRDLALQHIVFICVELKSSLKNRTKTNRITKILRSTSLLVIGAKLCFT